MLCNNLYGKRIWNTHTHTHIYLNCNAIHLKLTQECKSTTLQLKNFFKRGKMWRHRDIGGMSYEDGGRDWSNVSTSQVVRTVLLRKPLGEDLSWVCQRLEEIRKDLPQEALEGAQSWQHCEITNYQFVVSCYGSLLGHPSGDSERVSAAPKGMV